MRKLFVCAALCAGLFACKKDSKPQQEVLHATSQRTATGHCDNSMKKPELLQAMLEEILYTAKNSLAFKQYVYKECFHENYGDNYVKIIDLLNYNAGNKYAFWTPEQAEYLTCLNKSIQYADEERTEDPIIFVPFTEDINIDSLIKVLKPGIPEGVIADEYDSDTRECMAYKLDANDVLLKGSNRDEAYAWANELWVLAQAETTTPASKPAPVAGSGDHNRFNGQSEKGGIINVTDIGAIEPWVSGKVELKFFVFNQTGTKTNEISTGSTKRKQVKNTWKDFDKFLFNWNTGNIGNFIIEAWIEEDGGNSTSTVSSTLPAPCTGCPSTTISYTKQKNDDNMGQTILQFSDAISQEYNISYAKIKHKN